MGPILTRKSSNFAPYLKQRITCVLTSVTGEFRKILILAKKNKYKFRASVPLKWKDVALS